MPGFLDDSEFGHPGERMDGLYEGIVVNRNDPQGLGRVKVRIDGKIEPESGWAYPRGGGAAQFGGQSVPPLGAAVWVQFLNGNPERPVWEPGRFAKPIDHASGEQVSESFPEHASGGPDVHVWGIGPIRLVVDDRATAGVLTATASEPYNLTGGGTLSVTWDDLSNVDVEVLAGTLVNPGSATASEAAAALNKGLGSTRFYAEGGKVVVQSKTRGTDGRVEVVGGTLEGIFNFPSGPAEGGGERKTALRMVKTVAGEEDTIAELLFDVENNTVRLYATRALVLEAEGFVKLDCNGDVEIKGRKVIPTSRPVN